MTDARPPAFSGRTRLAAFGFAVLVGAVLGLIFGDGPSQEEEIKAVEDVAIAYGASDGAEACEFLSASALDQMGGDSGCTQQFETVPPAEFEVREVVLDGDSATATVRNLAPQGQVIELGFVKEDDEWRISSFPGLETIQPPTDVPEELAPPSEPEDGAPEPAPEETEGEGAGTEDDGTETEGTTTEDK